METNNRRKIWLGIFIVLTILQILMSFGQMKFAFNVAAGSQFADFIKAGVDPNIAKQAAFKAGYLSAFLSFFALPLPVYLLINLISAHFLGIRIKSRPIPLWRSMLIIFAVGVTFQTLSFSVWNKSQTIADLAIGSFGAWLLIIAFFGSIVGLGNLLHWTGGKLFSGCNKKKGRSNEA